MRTADGAVGIATRPSEKLAADEKVAAKRSIENPSISTCSNFSTAECGFPELFRLHCD